MARGRSLSSRRHGKEAHDHGWVTTSPVPLAVPRRQETTGPPCLWPSTQWGRRTSSRGGCTFDMSPLSSTPHRLVRSPPVTLPVCRAAGWDESPLGRGGRSDCLSARDWFDARVLGPRKCWHGAWAGAGPISPGLTSKGLVGGGCPGGVGVPRSHSHTHCGSATGCAGLPGDPSTSGALPACAPRGGATGPNVF